MNDAIRCLAVAVGETLVSGTAACESRAGHSAKRWEMTDRGKLTRFAPRRTSREHRTTRPGSPEYCQAWRGHPRISAACALRTGRAPITEREPVSVSRVIECGHAPGFGARGTGMGWSCISVPDAATSGSPGSAAGSPCRCAAVDAAACSQSAKDSRAAGWQHVYLIWSAAAPLAARRCRGRAGDRHGQQP